MTNQNIINYLNEGIKRGFSLNLLKQKLLEAGFQEKDINESLKELNNSKSKNYQQIFKQSNSENTKQQNTQKVETPDVPYNMPLPEKKKEETTLIEINKKPSGIRWMKIGGVIGIILLILITFVTIMNFIPGVTQYVKDLAKNTAGLAVVLSTFGFIIILTIFYYLGFAKLGKHINSKSLKFASWSIIIIIILFVLLALILGIIASIQGTNNTILNKTSSLIFNIIFGLLILYSIIAYILFIFGLFVARKQVKLAIIPAITRILIFIILIVGIIIASLNIINNFGYSSSSIISILSNSFTLVYLKITIIGIDILSLLTSLFESIVLLQASKKFE